MENKRILITGGAGFIGSNLAHHLSQRNEVIVLDDLSTGKMANLDGAKVRFIEGDIRTVPSIPEVDFVLHLAAYISVPGSVLEPEKNDSINILGTQNILAMAKASGVKKLVFASSAAVYGDVAETELPVVEDRPLMPASPYAGSKMTAEDYCLTYNEMFGLRTTVLRMFNVYGPRQDPNSQYAAVIPAFIRRAIKGQRPIIYGDGTQTRDFIYVGDVARAFELAALTNKSDGQVINIASGQGTSVRALAQEVAKAAQKKLEPMFEDPRSGDIKHSVASASKAKRLLGWDTNVSLSKGLKLTYADLVPNERASKRQRSKTKSKGSK